MKKKKRIVRIILWLAALAVLFIWSLPEQRVSRFVAKNAEVLEESLGLWEQTVAQCLHRSVRRLSRRSGHSVLQLLGRRQRASHRRILLRPVDSAWPPVLRLLLFA